MNSFERAPDYASDERRRGVERDRARDHYEGVEAMERAYEGRQIPAVSDFDRQRARIAEEEASGLSYEKPGWFAAMMADTKGTFAQRLARHTPKDEGLQ